MDDPGREATPPADDPDDPGHGGRTTHGHDGANGADGADGADGDGAAVWRAEDERVTTRLEPRPSGPYGPEDQACEPCDPSSAEGRPTVRPAGEAQGMHTVPQPRDAGRRTPG